LNGVLNDIADSTHPVEPLRVRGTVVAEPPPPATYWLHPLTELQLPTSAYPDAAVYVTAEAASALPTMNESEAGVKEATAAVVEPEEELPVEESAPDVVNPVISYIETEPATVVPKAAVIVSAPEVAAIAYHTYE
jgi:hypothetical protein